MRKKRQKKRYQTFARSNARNSQTLLLEWPTGPAHKFAQTARAKATAQLIARAKEKANTPTRAKAKERMAERATASPHTEAKAMARKVLAKDSIRARAKASTAWMIHIHNGLQNGISNGLENGLRHRHLKQPLLPLLPWRRNILG